MSSGMLAQLELEAGIIANISKKFALSYIEIPIISIYKSKTSHISDNLLKSRKQRPM